MINEKCQKIAMGICIAITLFFATTVALRLFAREIFIKGLQIQDNPFIDMLFWDQPKLLDTKDDEIGVENEIASDSDCWAELYPFPVDEEQKDEQENGVDNNRVLMNDKIEQYEEKVNSITKKFSIYTSDLLFGQKTLVKGFNISEKAFLWNLAAIDEYNAVMKLDDGRLSVYKKNIDVTENVDSITEFNEFCESIGLSLVYIQSPDAICQFDRASGVLDYSNQNADEFLKGIGDNGINYLDLRASLHADGIDHSEAFYKTDHHWKAETGLWAAGKIAEYLNENYDFSIDISFFRKENYSYEVYSKWFLGSRGKKFLSAENMAEDFTLIYPKFYTNIHYMIPSKQIDEIGDFSITYDMDCVMEKDYYGKNPYEAYNHSDSPVTIIENNLCKNGKKILVIKDSFTNTANPFLACAEGVSCVDILDIRYFDGCVHKYIEESGPDVVLVWYSPMSLKKNRLDDTQIYV